MSVFTSLLIWMPIGAALVVWILPLSRYTTGALAVPVSNPRKDLVQARLATWDISVKTGTEAASPTAPTADTDCIALAEIYCKPGMTSVKDASDGTNGYIIDVRKFL